MTRLQKFITSIFSAIFGAPVSASQSIFSTILDWTAAMYAEFVLIVMKRIETDYTPLLKPIISTMEDTGKIPPALKSITDEVKNPTHEVGAMLGNAVGGGMAGGLVSSTIGPWLLLLQYAVQRDAMPARFDPKTALAIKFRRPDKTRLVDGDIADQGWTDERRDLLMDVARTRLKEELLVTLRLRGIITKEVYSTRMYALGYDVPEAEDLYKSLLAYPGISDIVRMAVREAYTPEIAEKFGQYLDIPSAFITEAAKVGIPEEIARQYWAAHWDLPSTMQGFDMLHRGIITKSELELLMRALDIMPFWRDKLIQLSYAPFTRVDVRRMHKLGILTRAQVLQSYQDIGYSPEKAEALTKFTIALNTGAGTQTEKELTKADILTAYRSGLYDREECIDALAFLDYSPEDAGLIVDSVQISEDVKLKNLTLSQVKTLYQAGLRTKQECTAWLAIMQFDAAAIKALFDLWDWAQPVDPRRPTRTDLDNFISSGVIDLQTWSDEYAALGYDMKYQEMYFAYLVERGKVQGS
jgi:hypothetical protein